MSAYIRDLTLMKSAPIRYEDIVFTRFFKLLPTVTLTFDILSRKSNQHIYEHKYICDQNWVKFPSMVSDIWCSQVFRDAQTHSLTDGHTRKQYAEGFRHKNPIINGMNRQRVKKRNGHVTVISSSTSWRSTDSGYSVAERACAEGTLLIDSWHHSEMTSSDHVTGVTVETPVHIMTRY